MNEYGFLFTLDSLDLEKTDVVKHHIELSDYTPIKDRYQQIPPHQYDEVRKHLQEMLAVGAIRKSNSPWASPVMLVRKKDGSLRFCIDLRKLNARTIKDAYSLPCIEDALDSLDGACLFTSLDLKSGYWQVELDEESIPLTAFTVGLLGFYECVRMPFGLTNAPATFQRLMETCLGELHLNWCIIYLDDIIIFSKTPEEHLCRLRGMFERLAKAGLKLKPSKCEFFRDSLRYLGHVVSPKDIATDPKKIEAIQRWPVPHTVTDVRSFIGFTNYYRRYIKDYAKVSRPLHELTSGDNAKRKRQRVEWDERCQEAFEKLKEACSKCPVLAYANYKEPFILHTDASTMGLGAVLSQKQPDGTERVVAYASRSLNKSERNYDAHKLEFLALKWAITEQFHEYLYGAARFDVFTDNNPLTYVLTTAKLDAMGHRWVASLGSYYFDLHYKPGKKNPADPLSRIDWSYLDSQTVKATLDLARIDRTTLPDVGMMETEPLVVSKGLQAGEGAQVWKQRQEEDPLIAKLKRQLEKGELEKDSLNRQGLQEYKKVRRDLVLKYQILYRRVKLKDHDKETYQFVVPNRYRRRALELIHDEFGHLGVDRTTGLMQERFYWPHMSDDIRMYIRDCMQCIKFKQKGEQEEMVSIKATYPHFSWFTWTSCRLVVRELTRVNPFMSL